MIINFKFTATNGRVYEGMRTEFDRNYPDEGTAMFFVEDEDNMETGGYFEVNMIKDADEGGKLTGKGYVCEYPQSDMVNPANILEGDKVEIELIEHDFDEVLEKANADLQPKGLMIVADYDPETDVWDICIQVKATGDLNYFASCVATDDVAEKVNDCWAHARANANELTINNVFDGTLAVSFMYDGKRYQEVIIPDAAESDPDIEDIWHYPINSHDDGLFMRLFGSYGDDDELLTSGVLQVRVQNTHTGEEEYIDDVDVIGADEVNNYPNLYDEISDTCSYIDEYCGYKKMTGEETDAVSLKLMDKMQDLSSQLKEVAKELLDHKAWDK